MKIKRIEGKLMSVRLTRNGHWVKEELECPKCKYKGEGWVRDDLAFKMRGGGNDDFICPKCEKWNTAHEMNTLSFNHLKVGFSC